MESHGPGVSERRSTWDRTVKRWWAAFMHENLVRMLAVVGAIILWWIVSAVISERHAQFLPGPQAVLAAIIEAFRTEGLGKALWGALFPLLTGFLLSIVIGIPLGMLMGISRTAERFLDSYVNGLYVAPVSALIPAMIFWFGSGFEMRAIVALLFGVFVIIVNTMQGTKHTPNDFVELARSFGASSFYISTRIVIPSAIPYIMVGLRLALGRAIVGTVIAELLVSVTGVGEILTNYSSAFRLDGVLGVSLVIMTGGALLTGLMQWLEKAVTPWRRRGAAFED